MFNEILEGGLNGVLVRRLAMQTASAAPALQPEIVADITLESDRPEWGVLKQEYRYSALVQRASVAPGAHSAAKLFLPLTSGGTQIATIEGITASVDAFVMLALNDGGFTPAAFGSPGIPRDPREPEGSNAQVQEGFCLALDLATAVKSWRIRAGDTLTLPIIVAPYPRFLNIVYSVTVASIADQVAMDVGFFWRERTGNPGELA